MAQTYKPRRAGNRWLQGAPSYIHVCFYDPKFTDGYTIFTRDFFHVASNGTIKDGADQYHNTYIWHLGTSADLGISGWNEMAAHVCASYRYRCKHRRIKWADIPDAIKQAIEDTQNDAF